MCRHKTYGEIAEEKLKGKNYDHAIPQEWANEVRDITNIYTAGCIVWLYDEKAPAFGRPYPLDLKGHVALVLMDIKY